MNDRPKAPAAVLAQDLVHRPQPVRAHHLAPLGVPEEQVQVVQIEAVQIHRLARPLLHLAKGHLPQAADLAQHVGDLRRAGDVRGQVAARLQPLILGEGGHLPLEALRRHRRDDGLLGCVLAAGADDVRQAATRPPREIAEEIGVHPQVLHQRVGVLEIPQLLPGQHAAEKHLQRLRAPPHQLARQQRRPQQRMHQARQLEEHPVAPGVEDRQHRRPRPLDDGPHVAAPGGIGDPTVAQAQMRHRPRRKDHQHPAVVHPPDGPLENARVAGHRLAPPERIHREDPRAHLRNRVQQVVAQEAHIGAQLRDDVADDQRLEAPHRVVAHHDQRALGRNLLQVVAGDGIGDPQRIERDAEEILRAEAGAHLAIDPVEQRHAQAVLQRKLEDARQRAQDGMPQRTPQVDQFRGMAVAPSRARRFTRAGHAGRFLSPTRHTPVPVYQNPHRRDSRLPAGSP